MPNFWAHRICAGVTLQHLHGSAAAELIKRNATSFRLGSQGADLMYFRPLQLLRGRKGAVYHAKMLHSLPVDRLAAMSLKYLASAAGTIQFESTFAYICGFLCHHAVDQKVHPFIDEQAAGMMRHRRIELDFDAYLSRALGVNPDRDCHHWTGLAGFIDFAGLAQWYNHMFHGLSNKRFSLRSFIRDYKAMRRMSGILDKPRRLVKEKHTDRPVLPERVLGAMMNAALQGAKSSAELIDGMCRALEPHITALTAAAGGSTKLWVGI